MKVEQALNAADLARYQPRVRGELLDAICTRLRPIIVIEAVLSTILIVALLWEVATPLRIATWLVVHAAIVLLHAYVYAYHRSQARSIVRLRAVLAASMFLSGLYWAALMVLMFVVTPDYAYHLYLFLYVGILGVIALIVVSEDVLSFCGFVIPPMLGLSIVSALTWEPRYMATAMLGVLGAAALCILARMRNHAAIESWGMRFALLDLAQELSEQRDVANQANIAKSKFLAAASHDLRQPMHALTLLTAALQDADSQSDVQLIADDIRASVGSLEKMFDALLDVSRLDAGVLEPTRVHFRLDELLRRLVTEHSVAAHTKGLTIHFESAACVAYSDPLLIERIVRNYLSNAVRYTLVGSIRVACRQTGGATPVFRVEILDTGIGIAVNHLSEIFDEFHQVGNPERDRSKGLGLGLAIVRRIAELLDHEIGVESNPGEGACFFVAVPVGEAALVSQTKPVRDPTPSLKGLRVLVIDDDAAIRDSMRRLLTLWGCHCVVADGEEEAVTAARTHFDTIDVIVVDYRLRGQRTGVEAIARLRTEFAKDIPALVVSGDTAPERLREVASSGHTLVHKPIQPPALRAFLANSARLKIVNPPPY